MLKQVFGFGWRVPGDGSLESIVPYHLEVVVEEEKEEEEAKSLKLTGMEVWTEISAHKTTSFP